MAVVAGLVLLVLAGWFVIPDENLRDEAAQILHNNTATLPEPNAYYALWGLKAEPSRDAHETGKRIVQAIAQARGQHRTLNDVELQKFWGTPLLLGSTEHRFCENSSSECLTQIRAAREKIEAGEGRLKPYIQRYRALRAYTYSDALASPGLDDPQLSLAEPVALSDLVDARIALDMAVDSKRQYALEELAAELKLWRHIVLNTHGLIQKMVATAVLHRKFRLASELLAELPEIAVTYPQLLADITRPLAASESAIGRSLTGEFRMVSSMFLDLAREREFDGVPDGLGRALNKAWMVGVFKPNATINAQYVFNRTQRDFYGQPASVVFEQEPEFLVRQNDFSPFSLATLFYNPAGKVLIHVAYPDYGQYVYALHDLAAYTRLLELQRRIAVARMTAAAIPAFVRTADAALRDPYTDKPMHWDAKARTLSLQGHGKRHHDKLAVRVATH